MIRKLLTLSSWLIISASPCFGLDADEIREIAKKPHSREALLPELEIYPDVREYAVTSRMTRPGEPAQESKTVAKEKTVEGKYIVTEFTPPGAPAPFVMVTTFDGELGVYKKWLLLPGDNVGESIGTAMLEKGVMSWVGISGPEGTITAIAVEIHGEEETTWREVIMIEGGTMTVEGTARKIR